MTSKDITTVLTKYFGFTQTRIGGRHHTILSDGTHTVVIPSKTGKSKEIGEGTLGSILRQAGLKKDEIAYTLLPKQMRRTVREMGNKRQEQNDETVEVKQVASYANHSQVQTEIGRRFAFAEIERQ
jgi:predicted RNA binding protein YcfA (HicA-like mRNA interferase family)